MVLIFHLDISGSDFGRPMGSLLGSLLKYNALEVFQQVFQTTSRNSSDGVFFHIKWSLNLSLSSGRLLGSRPFRCIKSFKLVVHGGWYIDGNGNIVNT
uniref:Uncharacterized protein n=1 Tax=Brassica oleracea TaxID=3712 RepID=A0A3P6E1H3_BRAOL|nr:unnamed protein product [Brassica oleracea]